MAVIERAGREQDERDQAGGRPTDAAADAPGDEQPDDADGGPDQTPRLEQSERQHFGGERRRHVEAAAIFVEIDEGESARVGEARAVKLEQQVAVLRVGIVIPAEAVVAEGYPRDDGDRRED